jgi:hypothetical protein
MQYPFTRRSLIAGALSAAPFARWLETIATGTTPNSRVQAAQDLRNRAAFNQSRRVISSMVANGDEDSVPNLVACFSKGLPRNQFGEVEPTAYRALLAAIKSQEHADFERIPRGGGRKLSNPQAAFTYHLEGGDPHTFDVKAAPSIKSEVGAWETSELYWQSLCRDIPFSSYESSVVANQAAASLGSKTAGLFRGSSKACLHGPYVSQFLLKPVPYGGPKLDQRYRAPVHGSDFLTTLGEWSQIQSGIPPWREATYDSTPRYIRTGRDLAEYVHYDFPYQAYLNAALILINSGPKSILNCNQFKSANNPYRYSTVQEGFVTFGQAEVTDWMGRVTTAALKAAYCQKWMAHRRIRPEALGGLIHLARVGTRQYPVHPSLLNSRAVDTVFSRTGSYLLPQAYPEGCPLHPSYPSGHAAIAGACSVVLKACFEGSMLLPGCVEPSADGTSLAACSHYSPTVGDEIDKLASNIAIGRSWAGIHYRSDNEAGLLLGEEVGISILQDLASTYTESFPGFSFKRFDSTDVRITPKGEVIQGQVRHPKAGRSLKSAQISARKANPSSGRLEIA